MLAIFQASTSPERITNNIFIGYVELTGNYYFTK